VKAPERKPIPAAATDIIGKLGVPIDATPITPMSALP